jgi:hypothetical protein
MVAAILLPERDHLDGPIPAQSGNFARWKRLDEVSIRPDDPPEPRFVVGVPCRMTISAHLLRE